MNVLSSIFGTAVTARNALYDRKLLRIGRLAAPVVSVGNISVGGAGKTPFVIALGESLKEHGIRFDVLSRGYGRTTKGTLIVDRNGTPQQYGDEPLLITRKLGVPVIVSERRYDAGRTGEREFGSELHLLDDGFQHRELARDFDIVLLTAQDLRDTLLPAGRLRETPLALLRADALVVSENFDLPRAATGKPIWRITRELDTSTLPHRALAFCAIARPQQFFAQLKAGGVESAAEFTLRDHRAYVREDIRNLQQLAEQSGATAFITTEKDAINLGTLADKLNPLHIAQLRTVIHDEESVVQTLLATVEKRRASRA